MAIHIFTSITANYLPKARVLAHSVKRLHPDFRFHLVLCDSVPPGFSIEQEPFDSLIELSELGIPNLETWLFEHSLVEVSTGVKGFALVKILGLPDCSAVLYLDPDIVVLSSLDTLLQEFRSSAILLTPHICEPEETEEAILDNEISVLKHGVYNLGFVGVKNSSEGLRFATWWRDRLHRFCYDDIPNGIFTDQRWADLVPAYFPQHRVLRDAVYNVSTWNLTHRSVAGDLAHGITVNGSPIVFYHFSGLDSGAQQAMLDKYGASMPVLYELRSWYLAECDRMGQGQIGDLKWHYATFENGEPISSLHRTRYRTRPDLKSAFPNPFSTAEACRSFYHWFEANDETRVRPAPTALAPVSHSPRSLRHTLRYPVGNYRVFLSVDTEDPNIAAVEALRLARTVYARDQLYIVGAAGTLDRMFCDPGIAGTFAAVRLIGKTDHAASFCEVVRRFGDCDFLFVTTGVELSPIADLRLAWAAYRQESIATVSPISYGAASGHLSIEIFPEDSTPSLLTIDRACYDCSVFQMPVLPFFNPSCLFVKREAAQVAIAHGVREEDVFGSFLNAIQRVRLSHRLADHVCIGGSPAIAPIVDSSRNSRIAEEAVAAQSARVHRYLASHPGDLAPASYSAKPRQLHVMHSWGGGLERWVQEYCRNDQMHDNFVLKSTGTWGAFGMHLQLYKHIDDAQPLRTWRLEPSVESTAISHGEYRAALFDIIENHGIEQVMVSSLIGHSLDVLCSGLPTFVICHDYYPYCPALNISFHGVCNTCSVEKLTCCTIENPHNRFFLNVPPSYWPQLRSAFAETVVRENCTLIAPCASVRDHYLELLPDLHERVTVIPHGTPPISAVPLDLRFDRDERLRILVLGELAPHKGLALLQQIAPEVLTFADLYLVGCGSEYGAAFEGVEGVRVIPKYVRKDLPEIIRQIDPHAGLLLSVVPETFSFTLQELFELAVPVVCTRIGSFADRIEDGVTGYLCELEASQIVGRLHKLDQNREDLSRIHARLRMSPQRTIQQMLDDYCAQGPLPPYSGRAYFASRACQQVQGTPARCQLYWRTEEANFDEVHSSADYFSTEIADHFLRISIPASVVAPFEFRLDPSDRPGAMIVHRLGVKCSRGRTLWTWNGDTADICRGKPEQIEFVQVPEAGSAGLFHCMGDDPRFVLPFDAQVCQELRKGGLLEIECTWMSPGRASVLLSWAHALNQTTLWDPARGTQINLLEEERKRGREELEYVREELEHSRLRVKALETSVSWRCSAPLRVLADVVLRSRSLVERLFAASPAPQKTARQDRVATSANGRGGAELGAD